MIGRLLAGAARRNAAANYDFCPWIWPSEKTVLTPRPLVVWPQVVPLASAPAAGGDRRTVAGKPAFAFGPCEPAAILVNCHSGPCSYAEP